MVASNSCRVVHHTVASPTVVSLSRNVIYTLVHLVFMFELSLGYKQTPYAQKLPSCQDNCYIIIHVHRLIQFPIRAAPAIAPYYAKT